MLIIRYRLIDFKHEFLACSKTSVLMKTLYLNL